MASCYPPEFGAQRLREREFCVSIISIPISFSKRVFCVRARTEEGPLTRVGLIIAISLLFVLTKYPAVWILPVIRGWNTRRIICLCFHSFAVLGN